VRTVLSDLPVLIAVSAVILLRCPARHRDAVKALAFLLRRQRRCARLDSTKTRWLSLPR